jgi:DNA invertase Pin-like site-specific DNA recombinase
VAKWTWRRDAEAQAKFLARQAEKGRQGGVASGKVRLAASEDLRTSARLMQMQGMSNSEISRRLGVPRPTVIFWLTEGVSEA